MKRPLIGIMLCEMATPFILIPKDLRVLSKSTQTADSACLLSHLQPEKVVVTSYYAKEYLTLHEIDKATSP